MQFQFPGMTRESTSFLLLCNWQSKPECSAFIHHALYPDLTTMTLYGQFAKRQSYAKATRSLFPAQSSEFIKDTLLISKSDTRTIIAHPYFDKDSIWLSADLDTSLRRCELYCVFQQINQYTVNHIHIYPNERIFPLQQLINRLVAARCGRLYIPDRFLN